MKQQDLIKVRTRTLKDGRKSIYLEYNHNGIKERTTLGLYLQKGNTQAIKLANANVMRTAEAIRANKTMDLLNGKSGLTNNIDKYATFTIIDIYDMYVKSREKNVTASTLSSYNSVKQWFIANRMDKTTAPNITILWFKKVVDMFAKQYCNNSANLYCTKVKAILRYAEDAQMIKPIKYSQVHLPSVQEVNRDYLTSEELKTFIQAFSTNRYAVKHNEKYDSFKAFLFSCYTGLRYSDIVSLTFNDYKNDAIRKPMQKTGHIVYIPVNEQAKQIILNAKGEGNNLFKLPTLNDIDYQLKKVADAIGINKHITFHTARHTFATLLIDKGVDLYTISQLLGHTNIKTTQIYAKVLDKSKISAVSLLDEM